MSKTYACWRVSSNEQNEARQLAAFQNCGEEIDEIFGDKMSGKSMDRPEYQRMVEKLEPGDLVIRPMLLHPFACVTLHSNGCSSRNSSAFT